MVNKFFELILDQLAPCMCQLCGQASGRPLALCRACQCSLAGNGCACPVCALPTAETGVSPCAHCQLTPPSFSSTTAPHLYTEPVDGFIKRLKFSADRHQLPVLAELMSQSAAQALRRHGRPDLLVPVPLHWRRQWRRGFNQANLLARQLCRHPRLQGWSLQVAGHLCTRVRATVAQQGLEREQRQRNIRSAFSCKEEMTGLHLVIVDDVMTTGATAEALARELLSRGARRVDVWCCARTPAPADNIPFGVCKPAAHTPY
jgi:ComF family protein